MILLILLKHHRWILKQLLGGACLTDLCWESDDCHSDRQRRSHRDDHGLGSVERGQGSRHVREAQGDHGLSAPNQHTHCFSFVLNYSYTRNPHLAADMFLSTRPDGGFETKQEETVLL